jgi:hypothetical protein
MFGEFIWTSWQNVVCRVVDFSQGGFSCITQLFHKVSRIDIDFIIEIKSPLEKQNGRRT